MTNHLAEHIIIETISFVGKCAKTFNDRQQIIERCQFLQSVMPDELFLYSIKTNPFAPLVASIAAQGFEADAASANEVLLAVQTGIAHESIFYSTPGKNIDDIEKSLGKVYHNCRQFF